MGPGEAHDPEPEPESESEGSDKRLYFIIEVLDDDNYKKRAEIKAYNAEAALRKSFPDLGEGEMKLVAVAATNWRIRTVQGQERSGMTVSFD